MSDPLADAMARARITFPERFAPDGTLLRFVRGRTWEQKRASWEVRQAIRAALDDDELSAAIAVIEPPVVAAPAAVIAPPVAGTVSVDVDDPFGGLGDSDDDAPYARVRGEA